MAVVPWPEPDGIVVVEPDAEGPSVPAALPRGLPALGDPDIASLALPDCKACAGVPGLWARTGTAPTRQPVIMPSAARRIVDAIVCFLPEPLPSGYFG